MTKSLTQTILVVDDMDSNIALLSRVLASVNVNILTAYNAKDGLRLIHSHDIDLLLLDVNMPKMSGFEMATELKKHDSYKNIPIIFITAFNKFQDDAHRLKGYEYGALDYIQKPIDNDTLKAKVNVFLRLRRQERQLLIHNEELQEEINRREVAEVQLRTQQEKLQFMAHYDEMTGLPNRSLFNDRFQQAAARSERAKNYLALCFLDIDDFKLVNDNFGHDIGDKLLINVAKRLESAIREEDTASRQGGDEFTLLLGDFTSIAQCEFLLARILKTLSQPYIIDDVAHNVSVSIGATIYPLDNVSLDTLIRHSDQAMYVAKLAGKNQFRFFNSTDNKEVVDKQLKLVEIRKALLNKQFCLYYQPKVNMKTGVVFGVEALIRWLHPDKGLIPPLDFLPLVDGTDLEIQIGGWVINEALSQLERWQEQGLKLQISINVSSYHMQSAAFFDQLNEALNNYSSINSQDIQLEILESSVLGDIDNISGIIKSCQNVLGLQIALDDFGTGYSSLSHMKTLSANTIKIDQSFVRDLLDDPNDYSIIDGVIKLAEVFNREVIAEGVETLAHGKMLLIMGCNEAQGYAISRPLPADTISQWIKDYTPNVDWVRHASEVHNTEYDKIILLKLTTKNWFNNINNVLLTMADSGFGEYVVKCHLGSWLSRFKKDGLFNEEWLYKIQQAHDVLYEKAVELLNEHQSGSINIARAGMSELNSAYEDVSDLLDEY